MCDLPFLPDALALCRECYPSEQLGRSAKRKLSLSPPPSVTGSLSQYMDYVIRYLGLSEYISAFFYRVVVGEIEGIGAFLGPVDPAQAPGYLDIVKKPIDLGKVCATPCYPTAPC